VEGYPIPICEVPYFVAHHTHRSSLVHRTAGYSDSVREQQRNSSSSSSSEDNLIGSIISIDTTNG
jgi:hypothetical protein